MSTSPAPERDHTPERLLAAGIRLFSHQGFAATSVRQICEAAHANVAAVNYHFGSKRDLYDAVLDRARAESNARNTIVQTDTARDFWADAAPEDRLRRFIAMSLEHALDDDGGPSAISRLMFHELLDPTPAFDRQIEVSIARVFEALRGIVRQIAGPAAAESQITRLALMINAQCQYPALAARSIGGLHPDVTFGAAGREALATTIATAMIAAIRSLPEG